MVSQKFKNAVKLDPRPQYKLAWMADVNPVVLSQIITGYIRPNVGDVRVLKVGRLLGLKDSECFSKKRHNNE